MSSKVISFFFSEYLRENDASFMCPKNVRLYRKKILFWLNPRGPVRQFFQYLWSMGILHIVEVLSSLQLYLIP